MAQLDLPSALLPSLKDRLLDPDSMGTRERPGYSLRQNLNSVRNDLDELLNTRRSHELLETQFAALARSIVTYGLPDLTSFSGSLLAKQEEIGRVIEKVITLHEPRLRNVRVTQLAPHALDLRAQFHIDAELCVDPAPAVDFETVVELTTGHAFVRQSAD